MTLRVLITDDEELVRTGFRMILEATDDIEVVGEADDGALAVELARQLAPDVVLMDLRMKGMDGVTATAQILAENPAIKIVVLTTFDLDDYVYNALRSGVSGFLLKDTSPAQLVAAVRVVASGQALMEPSVVRRVIDRFARPPAPAGANEEVGRLTERELEVLKEVASGATNAEIAGRLYISETTVKTHVGSMLSKLGFRDRTQLVVFAYETGVVRPGDRVD